MQDTPVPLSIIHAEALYRPRPPVAYDDEGYPFEDAKLSESTLHDDVLTDFRNAATALVFDQPDAMVQRNLLMLFEEGNPTAAVEPDVTVSLGVGRHPRLSYKLWVEGKPPLRSKAVGEDLASRRRRQARAVPRPFGEALEARNEAMRERDDCRLAYG